jgi:hypothetical protein
MRVFHRANQRIRKVEYSLAAGGGFEPSIPSFRACFRPFKRISFSGEKLSRQNQVSRGSGGRRQSHTGPLQGGAFWSGCSPRKEPRLCPPGEGAGMYEMLAIGRRRSLKWRSKICTLPNLLGWAKPGTLCLDPRDRESLRRPADQGARLSIAGKSIRLPQTFHTPLVRTPERVVYRIGVTPHRD